MTGRASSHSSSRAPAIAPNPRHIRRKRFSSGGFFGLLHDRLGSSSAARPASERVRLRSESRPKCVAWNVTLARAETLAERPMFRGAYKYRRCIIPASGFYEWTGVKGAKTPHYFTARDGRPLALAGLWDHWAGLDGGDDLPNATFVVGAANAWMRQYHDRMPIILDWRDVPEWIADDESATLLRAPPDDALEEWIVSTRVNKAGVGDDEPTLIEPTEVR